MRDFLRVVAVGTMVAGVLVLVMEVAVVSIAAGQSGPAKDLSAAFLAGIPTLLVYPAALLCLGGILWALTRLAYPGGDGPTRLSVPEVEDQVPRRQTDVKDLPHFPRT
jgi:hypothetical protein